MDKRFQVFVSSTFRDLQAERQAVMQALLEMDAIPAGMELFPAANDDAWTLIERVIGQSDYYVLVVGGRYGSTSIDGLSFTEREYDFAVKAKVPVLAFLHEQPGNIPADKSEMHGDARKRLEQFREKVQGAHLCKFWNDAEQLGSRVSRSLMQAIRTIPRVGWLRADESAGIETLTEIHRLRLRIDELSALAQSSRTAPPAGTSDLAQGTDRVPHGVKFKYYTQEETRQRNLGLSVSGKEVDRHIGLNWDEIVSALGPMLLQDAEEKALEARLAQAAVMHHLETDAELATGSATSPALYRNAFEGIKVQLLALGLIQRSDKKRSTSDTGVYWTLTPYGEAQLIRVRALRRKPTVEPKTLAPPPEEPISSEPAHAIVNESKGNPGSL